MSRRKILLNRTEQNSDEWNPYTLTLGLFQVAQGTGLPDLRRNLKVVQLRVQL